MIQTMLASKIKAMFTVLNDKGLHTRPSTELAKCAANFESAISLEYNHEKVDAKSLPGILFLSAERGAQIAIEAEGPDAEAAVAALLHLADNRFDVTY